MTAKPHRAALLLALLAAVYLPFCGGGFLTDDFVHLLRLRTSDIAALVGSPDAFGFYRPITQLSLGLDAALFGEFAAGYRVESILLHFCVLLAAYALARKLLGSGAAAFAATLAYVLTPKAAPIAVLWISARGELLMTLFAMLSTIAWINWSAGRGHRWLFAAAAGYALALLSKESAILLPLLLAVTSVSVAAGRPADGAVVDQPRRWPERTIAAAALLCLAAVIVAWRVHVGALLPTTGDQHYTMATSVARWVRNARNYAERMLPAPLAVALLLGAPGLWRRVGRDGWRGALWAGGRRVVVFAIAWVAVFLLPVLPIAARNELYLYAPGFGLCLLCGAFVASFAGEVGRAARRVAAIACIVALCAYQGMRSHELHDEFVFSQRFVAGIESNADIAGTAGFVSIRPADAETARALRDTIGGYLDLILRGIHGPRIGGGIDYGDAVQPPAALRLEVRYSDGVVRLSRVAR